MKNIPIPSKSLYQLKVIDKFESVIKRIRWEAHFFMIGNVIKCDKGSSSFKSKNCRSQIKELESFEKDLLDIEKSIKFRNINKKFQNLMKADIAEVKASSNVFIPADKTANMYELLSTEYKKLSKDNITKTYKKAAPRLVDAINLEAKQIGKAIRLDDKKVFTVKKSSIYNAKFSEQVHPVGC